MHTSDWVSRRLPLSRHGWSTYACFLARQRREYPEGRPSSCPKKRRCCGATNQKADAAESPSPFHFVPWCCTSYVLWCFMSTMCIHQPDPGGSPRPNTGHRAQLCSRGYASFRLGFLQGCELITFPSPPAEITVPLDLTTPYRVIRVRRAADCSVITKQYN